MPNASSVPHEECKGWLTSTIKERKGHGWCIDQRPDGRLRSVNPDRRRHLRWTRHATGKPLRMRRIGDRKHLLARLGCRARLAGMHHRWR